MNDGPLIVQSDKTLLLEVDHEQADACRKAIAPFAELERSPEHIHTYRLTPLGLWNARAAATTPYTSPVGSGSSSTRSPTTTLVEPRLAFPRSTARTSPAAVATR